jgi:ribosomal protein S18 acetylase RimI-like enzyme
MASPIEGSLVPRGSTIEGSPLGPRGRGSPMVPPIGVPRGSPLVPPIGIRIHPSVGALTNSLTPRIHSSENTSGNKSPVVFRLRSLAAADRSAAIRVSETTGVLTPRSISSLLGDTIDSILDGTLPIEANRVRVAEDADGKICGWSYIAQDTRANGVWELWYIGVRSDMNGVGVGDALLRDAEDAVRFASGRMLIISVSSSPSNNRTRESYKRADYRQAGVVPNYYGRHEDKIIYVKSLEPVHNRVPV